MSVPEACCIRPPVLSSDYKPAGKHVQVAGLDTYVAGPTDAKKAVLLFYDAFGFKHQVFTAADLLASQMPDTVVLMPDFFKGDPVPLSAFTMPVEERKKAVGEFFANAGNPENNAEAAKRVVAEAKDAGFSSIEKWSAFGLCWGGRLTAMLSGKDTPFVAAGTGHPGGLVVDDAKAMTIPYICLFSQEDGTPELMKEYEEALKTNSNATFVDHYDKPHGWMAARADFSVENDKAEFERAYKKTAEFLSSHM